MTTIAVMGVASANPLTGQAIDPNIPISSVIPAPPGTITLGQLANAANNNAVAKYFDANGNMIAPVTGSVENAQLAPGVTGQQGAAQIQVANTNAQNALTTANAALPMSQVVSGTGMVPRLDVNGNATAPVLAQVASFGPAINSAVTPSFRAFVNPNNEGGTFSGSSLATIGGAPETLPHSPYGASAAFTQSLQIVGRQDGPYNFGFALGLFSDPMAAPDLLAPISGNDFRGGAFASSDSVQLLQNPTNINAHLIVGAASYTSTTVVLSEPLTAAEQVEAHPGAYISTNSLAGTQPTDATTTINDYQGIIKSVSADGTTITVYGWAPTSGADGTPSTTNLDNYYFTGYTTPVVFIGAPSKMFGRNTYMTYDGSKTGGTGGKATSLIHDMEAEEVDMNISNDTRPNSVSMHGFTLTPLGNTAALTPDSYDMVLAGVMPHHLEIWDGCGTMGIEASALNLPAECDLNLPTSSSGTAPNVQVAVFHSGAQANNNAGLRHNMDYQFWGQYGNPSLFGSGSSGATFENYIGHLGLMVDANLKSPGTSGSNLADIEWNQNGQIGGMSICGYGSNCGLTVEGGGVVDISQGLNAVKGIDMQSTSYVEGGNTLYIKPATLSNNLQPGLMGCDSYTICTTANIGANVGFMATGDLQSNANQTTRSGLRADGNGNWSMYNETTNALSNLTVNLIGASDYITAAVGYVAPTSSTNAAFTGQGSWAGWNQINGGVAATEYVNVDPASSGGFYWYDQANNGQAITPSSYLMNLSRNGATFNVTTSMNQGGSVGNGKSLTFYPTQTGVGAASLSGGIADQITETTNDGNTPLFKTGTVQATQGISNATFTYATLPSNLAAGSQVFCTDCYSSANANKTTGIPVWDNGSAWVDSLGNTAQH